MLQLSLNRWRYDRERGTQKDTRRMAVPAQLDLGAIGKLQTREQKNQYELLAILVHSGTREQGHYYAYIRPQIATEDWFEFNDERVTPVTASEALSVGSGGNFHRLEVPGDTWSEQRHVQDQGDDAASGYVLIYVRDSDIPWVLGAEESTSPRERQAPLARESGLGRQVGTDGGGEASHESAHPSTEEATSQWQPDSASDTAA